VSSTPRPRYRTVDGGGVVRSALGAVVRSLARPPLSTDTTDHLVPRQVTMHA
jgi:hypothetical protein